MNDLIGNILAKLAAQVSEPIEEDSSHEVVIARNVPKDQIRPLLEKLGLREARVSTDKGLRDSKPITAKKVQAQDTRGKAMVNGMVLPDPGTLSPREFLLAMRNAGKRRTAEGLTYTDPAEVRNDQIVAIAGYVGYDTYADFGSQELAAKLKANSALRNDPIDRSEWRRNGTPRNKPEGQVFGMPDMLARRQFNLEAQERLAAKNLAAHRNAFLAATKAGKSEQAAEAQVMMDLEEQRIAQIRADLRRLPGYQG
jgi:hypothetical protein